MRHFLSHVGKSVFDASRSATQSIFSCAAPARKLCLTLLVVCTAFLSSSFAQLPCSAAPGFTSPNCPFLTSRGDIARDGANTNETLLTPANVNKNSFSHLFSSPVDYVAMAQPLYMPNVNIPGQGLHNVVYVVTQADSVYAIDADNGTQLWYASMLNNVGAGATTASGTYLPCNPAGPGFNQEGIIGTPVIDPTTNTMYLVAKTLLNATVRHHIHALDITTGNEQPGSPVLITATSISKKGHVTHFNSLHQKNRPGLLMLNGVLYLGFGSNYCNDGNSGWVLSYDPFLPGNPASLSQIAVFNTSPDQGLTSIWQTGNGLAADEAGNLFVSTAEAGNNGYDIQNGGQTYCNSVIKLAPDLPVDPAGYFTPWNVAFLNSNDLDVSSAGALVLPDQDGPYPHEVIAGGKEGVVYVLDRDSMGGYSAASDSQIIQEIALAPYTGADLVMDSPAYWNNTVYFAPNGSPLLAFPLSSGLLGTPVKTSRPWPGGHSPSISANGNTNGVLWVVESGAQLLAFDAVSLRLLYATYQAPNGRDTLPPVGHFATQTVVNGRVYVATRNSLEAYGLLPVVTVTGGNAQTATAATALPAPIQVQVTNPYTGQLDVGATVNFSDGCNPVRPKTCGSFNPNSAITDSNGNASTIYIVPQQAGNYTLTISGTGLSTITATATATPGAATQILASRGSKQIGPAGSTLPNPLVAQAQDAYKNGVAGVTVNFSATHGGVPTPASVVTNAQGFASTTLQLPTTVSNIIVKPSSSGLKTANAFGEYSIAGPAANIGITSGSNQSAPAGSQLPLALTVLVTDRYGNPVSENSVTFSDGGAGGIFSNPNPIATGANGTATQSYTLPASPGTVTIDATAAGVASPAVFTETGH